MYIACSAPTVPGGRIVIRNDILDKEFNIVRIDQVISNSGLTGFSVQLKPGEQTVVPHRHIRSMRFFRQYDGYARVYVVTCPTDLNQEIVMKLIDVHTNRLSGGCVLSKKGKQSSGGVVTWEE